MFRGMTSIYSWGVLEALSFENEIYNQQVGHCYLFSETVVGQMVQICSLTRPASRKLPAKNTVLPFLPCNMANTQGQRG